ncbi:MAG: DUF1653 domain-containing protein [Gammaproteobacteria bacterium]|nr:DUF1653 domain-containing protein [Gammaproteobacteria bacterium]
MDDLAEESYWRFDARRKGYGPWKEAPQSERDAYKAELAALRAQLAEAQAKLEAAEKSSACPLRYRHYKGGTYEYITDGHLEWDPEWHVIVYRAEADGSVWVRPRVDFYGVTEDGQRRFVKIEPEEAAQGGDQ